MIRCEEHPEAGYVEVTLDGKVDRAGFEDAVAKLEPMMKARGKIGLLKHIVSFGGIEPSVLWDDLKFGFHNLKHVGPVAVVGEKKWIEVWTKLASPFWSSDVRYFDAHDIEEARRWLAERVAALRGKPSAS